MNYYERHIGDYLKDTAHLSLLEHGIYTRLLDVYYTREGALPADQVFRLVGAREDFERAALRDVLNEFFTLEDGHYTHKRCERELERYRDKQRKASASATARWEKVRAHTERTTDAMRTHSEGNAPSNQTPDTKEEKTARKRATPLDCPEGIDPQVWADWLHLRKTKRAPVTATVLDGARKEAAKAGLSLEAFLRVWCRRGSQGLEADWLKPAERGQPAATTVQGESVEAYQARMAAERKAANEGISKPPPELREAVKAMVKVMRV